mmetsp:Transcript_11100/g.12709  ORF Transcript_11100/g.12709 Transcript_11100/m.12709 type:complete len:377 (-) Transcript_11100:77-1207(-)
MPCVELFPAPACGWNGECINASLPSSFCKCDEGFEQSLEWNFFVEEDELSSSLCMFHTDVVYGVWISATSGFIFCALLSAFLLDWEEIKRQKRIMMFLGLGMAEGLYRVLRPESALLGVDLAFTFVMSIIFFLFAYILHEFFHLNVDYIKGKLAIVDSRRWFIRNLDKIRRVNLILTLCFGGSAQLIWAAAIVEKRKTGKMLIQSFMAFCICYFLFTTVTLYFALTDLLTDMRFMVAHVQTNSESHHLKQRINDQLPLVWRLRAFSTAIFSFWAITSFLLMISDFWMHLYIYIMPTIANQAWIFCSIYIIFRKRSKRQHGNSSMMARCFKYSIFYTQQGSKIGSKISKESSSKAGLSFVDPSLLESVDPSLLESEL